MNPLIKELKDRGLLSQTFGNLDETFSKPTTFYIGIDPTADSLGVHHMIGLIAARIMQNYGHKPIILVGGATCAIGDPSGKSQERNVISMENVFHNVECVKKQIAKILDFDSDAENAAVMVNNYDWYKDFTFLGFMREVGKKISVNYLMAKENVRKRLERDGSGISVQEFSYGLLQGYDFVHLYRNYNCKCQIAGTDNLGNMVTGQDLVHKMLGKDDVCGITWDLVTCADGRKFGKTEGNSVWLDANKTTPYEFFQFWVNQSDEDSERFIKLFTLKPLEEIDALIEKHRKAPSKRLLQHELAKEVMGMVHSVEEYEKSANAAGILFGNGTKDQIESMDPNTFLSVMKGVSQVNLPMGDIEKGITMVDLCSLHDKVTSKTEARKLIKGNGFSLNKSKVTDEKAILSKEDLIGGKYLLLQKGKKDYTVIISN